MLQGKVCVFEPGSHCWGWFAVPWAVLQTLDLSVLLVSVER